MNKATQLSQLVTVRGRFHRSVSLARDWKGSRDFSEYVVTPAVRAIAEQILDELRQPNGARAWSLTGPYGTGKSAFALFLADVLSSPRPGHDAGKQLRRQFLPRKKRMLPVLVQAERAPLLPAVLEALASELRSFSRPLALRARRMREQEHLSGEAVAEFVIESADKLAASGVGGLAIIVDELGKYLEFASSGSPAADVYVLQQLAEATSRSTVPVLFTTILHTGFADYLAQDDEVRRAEWQKVQGRFRDVPFQLPSEQLLALVAHALEVKFANGIDQAYGNEIDRVVDCPELSSALNQGDFRSLLPQCLPLDPLVSLILWPLFRSKIAQNERSLFAFLTSQEPYGFQEFLRRSSASPREAPTYGLAQLYDYVVSSLGVAAFSGSDSRRWALTDHALDRVPASSPPVALEIIKAVGLLSQYGSSVGVRSSRAVLELALGDRDDFEEALALLERESILVYRRHSASYGLWEGSDVDLDQIFVEARSRLSRAPLHERLERALDLPPAVARAHYVKTGTLRFFESSITAASARALDEVLGKSTQADGRILFIVDSAADSSSTGKELSLAIPSRHTALVAVPRLGPDLLQALEEWECWKWVREHVTELEGDPVARQEVQARLEAARSTLERTAGPIFGLSGHVLEPRASDWYFQGKRRRPTSARDFQGLLSGICEDVFCLAPALSNELLNRHNLSSAAARARRNLIERIVRGHHQENLGIHGFPPEYSMYRAMLAEGGFHRRSKGVWRLGPPTKAGWPAIWEVFEDFLRGARQRRKPVADLIGLLKAAPYGLRDGPIPVFLATGFLVRGHEVALYEDGVFVPEISIEVLERLIRRPETFELQSYQLSESERQVLSALAEATQTPKGADALLGVVKSLVRAASSLPPYSKQTRSLTAPTCAVRDALLGATDPKALLFEELPHAVGIGLRGKQKAIEFSKALQVAMRELSHAYLGLLDSIEEAICIAFGLSNAQSTEHPNEMLRERSAPLVPYAMDPKLQVFVREAARDDERDWREVLGRAANDGKPPAYWQDQDVAGLKVQLQALAAEFDRLEELVAAAGQQPNATVISVGVLGSAGGERRTVVSCPAENREEARTLTEALRGTLRKSGARDDRTQLLAVAELLRELYGQVHSRGTS